LKRAIAKEGIYFYELKTATLENDFNQKTKLANQRRIWFCSWVAQRFALVVCGRAGKMPESRKNPKPENCL